VEHGEDCNEFGGYFIVNGNEKLVRMLIAQKRNFPIAFKRPGYRQKGFNFSQNAVQMRCVREDMYTRTLTLHYLNDGNVYLRILLKKKELQMPVIIILKALEDLTDLQVYQAIVRGKAERSEISDRMEVMISEAKTRSLYTRMEALAYIGRLLRVELNVHNHHITDVEVG
jgi:DNA-directed RNA polymerase I subunit RPA2